jgi:hypothetical protein
VYGMGWMFKVANSNSTMLLKRISLLNLEINVREHELSFLLISFFQADIKVPIVLIFQTLVHFFNNNILSFCIVTCFFHTKYLRDNTKHLEHLFVENLNRIFFMFSPSVGEKYFFGGTK